MKVYKYALKTGITRTKEFERKRLATHAVNVGIRCGHECTYCSTPSLLRMHPAFKALGLNPFDRGYAIVDPTMPERVARDAERIRKRGMVQLCTTVDAWSPERRSTTWGGGAWKPSCLNPAGVFESSRRTQQSSRTST